MGFLERAIRRGVSDAVGKAVGQAITNAVEPKATELVNKAADKIDSATTNVNTQPANTQTNSALEGAFSNFERAASKYATEAAKNMKVCPACGESTTADKNFCPSCGEKLPEKSIADELVCTSCGTQNNVGTKFCQNCGAKLPFAVNEENAQLSKDQKVLDEFKEYLPQYPVWSCGGKNFILEKEPDYCWFSARFDSNFSAEKAVEGYRQLLMNNGFRQAGQYPSICHLYKMINGTCYHADTEHCFEGDSDTPTIYFNVAEPAGGFDYVKPEPKKQKSFFDLFK